MEKKLKLLSLLAALTCTNTTLATTIETLQYFASIPPAPTNSSRFIALPRFDPALGELKLVELLLCGRVEGSARFESLNAAPRTVTLNLAAEVTLKDEFGGAISAVLPSLTVMDDVDAFDGIIDFAGNSGREYTNLSAQTSAPLQTYVTQDDLAKFIGLVDLLFPVQSVGHSSAVGPGNLVVQFETSTAAWVEIVYHYAPIPEPAGLVGVMFAVLCGGRCRIRRKP